MFFFEDFVSEHPTPGTKRKLNECICQVLVMPTYYSMGRIFAGSWTWHSASYSWWRLLSEFILSDGTFRRTGIAMKEVKYGKTPHF